MRLKKFKLPTLMVGRPNRVLWKKILGFAELQIYEKPLRPDGILRAWIPLHIACTQKQVLPKLRPEWSPVAQKWCYPIGP